MSRGPTPSRFLIALLSLSLVASACGGGDSDANASSQPLTEDDDVVAEEPVDSSTDPAAEETTTTAPPTTTTSTTQAPPPDLELIGPGEFGVGVTTVTIAENTDRPLTLDIWFPLDDATGLDAHEYTFLPGIFYRSPIAVTASFDVISAAGPFPLIAYSHGSGGQRFIHSNFTETLASHGHVVVAADHTGNTLIESFVGAAGDAVSSAEARPGDIDTMLDAVLGTESSTELSETLSPFLTDDPVVISGHSLGGFTSYASIAGLTTENVDIAADERIGAAIAMAPFATAEVLPDELLARVDVPQLIIVGSDDKSTPVDPNVERLWDLTAGSPAYRVELAAGEHLTFTDMCDYVTFLPELGTVPDFIVTELETRSQAGCAEGDMPIARAQELTNTFAVRFLDAFYNDEPFIDPDAEILPDDIVFAER